MSDLIDRQAALEVLNRRAREKFSLRDEFQYYLNALIDVEDKIKALPSAQPEIVQCRECKYQDGVRCFRWNSTIITGFDDFCSNGERRCER